MTFFLGLMLIVQVTVNGWEKAAFPLSVDDIAHVGNKLVASDLRNFRSYQLTDGSTEWKILKAGHSGSYTSGMLEVDSLQWIATQDGFFYSSQSRSDWTLYGDTTRFLKPPYFPTSFAVIPTGKKETPYRLFSGTFGSGFYRSDDGGHSWTEIDSARFHNHDVTDLRQSKSGNPDLYLITLGGFCKSTDLGESWGKTDPALKGGWLLNMLWQTDEDWFISLFSGLYRQNNQTGEWEKCTGFFGENRVIAAKTSINGILFAGVRSEGLYFSEDRGTTWNLADSFSAQGNTGITGLATDGTALFVSTASNGIWKKPMNQITATSVQGGSSLPARFAVSVAYPNPFNPATGFTLDLPDAGPVRVRVFDLAGRLIRDQSAEYPAGRQAIRINLEEASAGIYLIRIQSGSENQIRKVVLIK